MGEWDGGGVGGGSREVRGFSYFRLSVWRVLLSALCFLSCLLLPLLFWRTFCLAWLGLYHSVLLYINLQTALVFGDGVDIIPDTSYIHTYRDRMAGAALRSVLLVVLVRAWR